MKPKLARFSVKNLTPGAGGGPFPPSRPLGDSSSAPIPAGLRAISILWLRGDNCGLFSIAAQYTDNTVCPDPPSPPSFKLQSCLGKKLFPENLH